MGDGEVEVGGEVEVAGQHQHQLLSVPLFQHKHQALKEYYIYKCSEVRPNYWTLGKWVKYSKYMPQLGADMLGYNIRLRSNWMREYLHDLDIYV